MEFATHLEMAGGEKIVLHAPGGSQVFRRSGKDEYLGPAGQRLVRAAQSSQLTTPEGAIIRFDVDGKEVLRQDTHGNKLASVHDSHGRLVRLSAGQQSEIHFKFRPDGRLVALEDRAGRKIEYAYDERSRLSRVRNVDGWTTDYHYGDKDLLTGITHADGSSESFVYDGQGRVVERRGPAGLVERYTYQGATLHALGGPKGGWAQGHDAEGRPLWREDATGRREAWTWSQDGQLLGRRYGDGSLLNLAYDDQGRLISQESSTGRRLRFIYDSRGRLQGLDSNGAVTRYQHDERGNVTAVTSPAGRTTRFEHDARGRPVSVVDGAGRGTRLEFDEQGRLIRREAPDGAVTRWEFDDRDRLLRQVDALGAVTTYQYQANGLLARVLAPGVPEARFEYDTQGRLVVEAQGGQRVEYGYDPAGSLVRIRHGDGAEERLAYHPDGRLAERKDPLGNATRWKYGVDGRLQELNLPSGLVARYEQSKPGQLRASLGNATTEIQRDSGSRVIRIRDATGGTQLLEMDAEGRLLSQVSPMGNQERFQYDPDGLLTEVILPSGGGWRFNHDRSALLDEIRFPDATGLRLKYDPAGRLSSQGRSWGGPVNNRYDALGRLIERTNARGQAVRYAYDAAGRLVSRASPEETWTYRYDERGNLVQAGNGRFSLRLDYDAHGRLATLRYPEWGQEIRWRRDSLGRVLRRTGPGRLETGYAYDKLGRLSVLEDGKGVRFDFAYDDFGRLVRRSASNGTTVRFEYDDSGRTVSVTHLDAAGKSFAARRYRHDADGNRVEIQDEQGHAGRFRYDPDGQLVAETLEGQHIEYALGLTGNRKAVRAAAGVTEYRHDSAGRLVQAGDVVLTYDTDGNLASRREGKAITRYRFDADGNLSRVDLPTGKTVAYGYGPFGERIWREEEGRRSYYLHAGDDVIAELSEGFEPIQSYLYAGTDQPLTVTAKGAAARFIHQDDLGTSLALTDHQGKPVGHYRFDSFGNVLTRQGAAAALPPRYGGRPLDEATGLYDMRARFYDPRVGRFISPDPVFGSIDDPLSFVPYLYARNNPWRYVDPYGEQVYPTEDVGYVAWGRPTLSEPPNRPPLRHIPIGQPMRGQFVYEHFHDTINEQKVAGWRQGVQRRALTQAENPYEARRLDQIRAAAAQALRAEIAANPTAKVPPAGGVMAGPMAQTGPGGATVISGQPGVGGLVPGLRAAGAAVRGAGAWVEAAAQPYAGGAARLSSVTGRGLMAIRMADIAGEALAADDPAQVASDRALELAGAAATSAAMGHATVWLASAAPAVVTVGGAAVGTVALTVASAERVHAAVDQRGQQLQAELGVIRAEHRAEQTSRAISEDRELHLDALRGKAAELQRLRGQLASQAAEAQALELEAANQRNAAQAKAAQVQALRGRIQSHEAVLAGVRGRLAGLDTNALRTQQAAIAALAQQACAEGGGGDRSALADQAESQAKALEAAATPADYSQALAQLESESGVADDFVAEAEELRAALQGYRRVIQERFGAVQGLVAGYAAALQQARNMQVAVKGSANSLRLFVQGDDLVTISAIAQEAAAGLPADGALTDAVQSAQESLGGVDVEAMLGGIANEAQSHAGVAALYLATVQADYGAAQGIAAQGREAANRARECAGRLGAQTASTQPGEPDKSARECSTDQDCALGYACNPQGACVRDPRFEHPDKQPDKQPGTQDTPPACDSDSDCAQGQRCRQRQCVTPQPGPDAGAALELFGQRERDRDQERDARGGGAADPSGGGRYTSGGLREEINLLQQSAGGQTGGATPASGGQAGITTGIPNGTGATTQPGVTVKPPDSKPTIPNVKPPPATPVQQTRQWYVLEAVASFEVCDLGSTCPASRRVPCTLTYWAAYGLSQTDLQGALQRIGKDLMGIVKGYENARLVSTRVYEGPSAAQLKTPVTGPPSKLDCKRR
jgi:RHS repeat-associated protein